MAKGLFFRRNLAIMQTMSETDTRKQEEAEFHDLLRGEGLEEDQEKFKKLTSNRKFYSITRRSDDFVHRWIFEKGKNKKLLDYCCGNGDRTIMFAKNGVHAVGIDISSTSIENAKREAVKQGVVLEFKIFAIHFEIGNSVCYSFFFYSFFCNLQGNLR